MLSLCSGRRYIITQPLAFTAPNQEISTQGYPTGEKRAILVVAGTMGHTTAVNGTCPNCDGVKLRNVQVRRDSNRGGCASTRLRHTSQIDGARNGHSGVEGGANIEMGGDNSGQLVSNFRGNYEVWD